MAYTGSVTAALHQPRKPRKPTVADLVNDVVAPVAASVGTGRALGAATQATAEAIAPAVSGGATGVPRRVATDQTAAARRYAEALAENEYLQTAAELRARYLGMGDAIAPVAEAVQPPTMIRPARRVTQRAARTTLDEGELPPALTQLGKGTTPNAPAAMAVGSAAGAGAREQQNADRGVAELARAISGGVNPKPITRRAIAATARGVGAAFNSPVTQQQVADELASTDTGLAALSPVQRALWNRRASTVEDRAQREIDALWREAKGVSGLTGPPPRAKFGDVKPGAEAWVRGKNVIHFSGGPEQYASIVGGQPPNVLEHMGRALARHEFAHIGQFRAPGQTPGENPEGRADRFAKLVGGKLGDPTVAPDFSSKYAPFRQQSRQEDTRGEILRKQFREDRGFPANPPPTTLRATLEGGNGVAGAVAAAAAGVGAGARSGGREADRFDAMHQLPKRALVEGARDQRRAERLVSQLFGGGGDIPGTVPASNNTQRGGRGGRGDQGPTPGEERADRIIARIAQTSSDPDARAEAAAAIKYGSQYDIPPSLLFSQLEIETPTADHVGPPTPYGPARGNAQFIKGTRDQILRDYGVDAWGSPDEAVHAQALLLKQEGFKQDPRAAIYSYNHSQDYVNDVISGSAQYAKLDTVRPGAVGAAARSTARNQQPLPVKTVTRFDAIVDEAKKIDSAQLPYVLGGGHVAGDAPGPRALAAQGSGYDCSSTVSRVLQAAGYDIPTIVSGDFPQYTKPGPGAVTIYSNDGHVFMKIGNRFFGTSRSFNPEGGAGWIPKDAYDESYLSQYTVTHVPGMGKEVAKRMGVRLDDTGGPTPGIQYGPGGTTATVTNSVPKDAPGSSDLPISGPRRAAQQSAGFGMWTNAAAAGPFMDSGPETLGGIVSGDGYAAPEGLAYQPRRRL